MLWKKDLEALMEEGIICNIFIRYFGWMTGYVIDVEDSTFTLTGRGYREPRKYPIQNIEAIAEYRKTVIKVMEQQKLTEFVK